MLTGREWIKQRQQRLLRIERKDIKLARFQRKKEKEGKKA